MTAPTALEQFIKSIPLFELVEPQELTTILRLLRPVELSPGQVLFREGEPGKAMWVLGDGLEISISTTPEGARRPVVAAFAKQGETVGEMALIDEGPRSATAVVVQGGNAHEISALEFHSLRQAGDSAAFKVLRRLCVELCRRVRATNERIVPPGQAQVATPSLEPGRPVTDEVLDEFPPFRNLPKVVKLALAQKFRLIEVHGLTPVFGEGEVGDAAYFLLAGEVTVGRNGRTFANLGPGAMFGLVSAIDQGPRSASCVTCGPARLLRLSDKDFDALFGSGHKFAFHLVELVSRQLVSHLRNANQLLPQKGGVPRPLEAVAPVASGPLQFDLDSIPLELEVDFESEGDLLG